MKINLFLEIIIILFAILASNGFICMLPFFELNKQKSFENISVVTNSSEKDVLAQTLLIASNPLTLISSESSASQTLNGTSSGTNVSQDIFDSEDLDMGEGTMTQTPNTNIISIDNNLDVSDHYTSLDSITILDSQTVEE
jgi:hypothetical protein